MGRVFFAGGKVGVNNSDFGLPVGYTELVYIQSTGTQYIDTGFAPNYNTRVVMDVNVQTPASATLAVFGVRDTKSSTAPLMFILWTTNFTIHLDR